MLGTRPAADIAFEEVVHEGALGVALAAVAAEAAEAAAAAAAPATPASGSSSGSPAPPPPLPGHVLCGGIEHRDGEPWLTLFPAASDGARDLLDCLLQWAPERRATVAAALAHPYFDALRADFPEPELQRPAAGHAAVDFSFEEAKHSADCESHGAVSAAAAAADCTCQTPFLAYAQSTGASSSKRSRAFSRSWSAAPATAPADVTARRACQASNTAAGRLAHLHVTRSEPARCFASSLLPGLPATPSTSREQPKDDVMKLLCFGRVAETGGSSTSDQVWQLHDGRVCNAVASGERRLIGNRPCHPEVAAQPTALSAWSARAGIKLQWQPLCPCLAVTLQRCFISCDRSPLFRCRGADGGACT